MSNVDDLPIWAGRTPEQTSAPRTPEPVSPRGKKPIFAAGGLAALLVAIAAVWFLTIGGGSDEATDTSSETATDGEPDEQASDDATSDGSASDDSASDTAAIDSEQAAAPSTTPESSEAADTDGETSPSSDDETGRLPMVDPTLEGAGEPDPDTAEAATTVSDNGDGDIRHAVFKQGQVFLRGRVPSEEVSLAIETKAGLVVGPDNVFNEYEIDPDVPADLPAPVYVEDSVLFGFNSVKIESDFLPILDLGTLLLTQNPGASITVVTRTDAVGSEETNLKVSQQRADAVVNYWIRQGIDASRLTADARGEEGASEDDDAQTVALQRRAEFVISGMLD